MSLITIDYGNLPTKANIYFSGDSPNTLSLASDSQTLTCNCGFTPSMFVIYAYHNNNKIWAITYKDNKASISYWCSAISEWNKDYTSLVNISFNNNGFVYTHDSAGFSDANKISVVAVE